MAVAAQPAMLAALPESRHEASPFDLTREASAAVLIDPVAAEILAANADGSTALGLFPYAAFPIALDPAMPAIARLRQIAGAGRIGKSDLETLLFWSSRRLKRVKCTVARQGGGGSKLLILHIKTVEAPDDAIMQRSHGLSSLPPEASAEETTVAPVKAFAVLDADAVAKLAHELKTPLTAIAAASEIMRDERLGEMKNARYLSYAADIHESATHALDVIASLLADRTRPAASVSRLIAIDLNAIVERTVSSVKALAESCGLNLTFETEGSGPHIVANPTALRQILLNLLTNAIKFTPRGGDVRVSTGHTGDGQVFLSVRDTGCGMSNPSNMATGSVSAATEQPAWARGNGIGLPLVEALIRDMGAEIQIDSRPHNGTEVAILFADFTRRFK
jgi:two-component system, cell cycle sensor histidine kinase PleC